MPAGYVPAVNDGFVTVFPDQPQVSDPITSAPGQPFTFQGRVTDEAGNLTRTAGWTPSACSPA